MQQRRTDQHAARRCLDLAPSRSVDSSSDCDAGTADYSKAERDAGTGDYSDADRDAGAADYSDAIHLGLTHGGRHAIARITRAEP